MSQQGFPPGRSSRPPHAGGSRSSRHAGPSRDEQDWDTGDWSRQPWADDPVEWPSDPDLAGTAGAGYAGGHAAGGHAAGGDYGHADYGRAAPPGPGPARGRRPSRPAREDWRGSDPFRGDESEAPPWAGPSIHATRAGGTKLRPPEPEPAAEPAATPGGRPRRRGRAAAARLRKSRRRVYIWCGSAIVIAVVVAGVAAIKGLHKPARHTSFITSLQPGEYRGVPRACSVLTPAQLTVALPGQTPKVTQVSTSGATSQCSFSVDKKPVFRVLEVTIQAYQPSAVAAGNGSATDNAKDAFTVTQLELAHPPKKSPLPAAQIAAVPQLGQQAFSAIQVVHSGHVTTDLVTVLARSHNVLVTVTLQAQASGNGFGPVSTGTVHDAAVDVARAVAAKAAQQTAVKA